MAAYRSDEDLRQMRLEQLERDLAEARWELEKKNEEIAELQDKENSRVNFYLGYNEEQVAALERENKELHQQVIALRSGMAHDASYALQRLASDGDLQTVIASMRREVRRTRAMFIVLVLLYWLTMGGHLPL